MTVTLPSVRVGIVGAGPGGLAAAILLRRLAFVQVDIFDQATVLREIGAGIALNENTWRLLKLLGAAELIEQYTTRAEEGAPAMQQRNGVTGELLFERFHKANPDSPPGVRIERTKLQAALVAQLPAGLIQLSKRLKGIAESDDGNRLVFEDGITAGPYDMLIGADGLRSIVRNHIFPDHKLSYTGLVAFRVLIPQSAVAHIPNIPKTSAFWHTPTTHVYTNPLDNGLFEIATRAREDEEHGRKVSWGQKISKDLVIPHYDNYTETIREIIKVPDEWLEFAMFGGPRLTTVTDQKRIALIGDASHPLSGAFGSGAAFAFEDAFVLASSLAKAHDRGLPISVALEEYNAVRHPRYRDLYSVLDAFKTNAADVKALDLDPNDVVNETVRRNWNLENQCIYQYNIEKVWAQHLQAEAATQKVKSSTDRQSELVTNAIAVGA